MQHTKMLVTVVVLNNLTSIENVFLSTFFPLPSYLHASSQHTYGRPIAGQKEISGSRTQSQGNLWKAMEGVYMEPDKNSL